MFDLQKCKFMVSVEGVNEFTQKNSGKVPDLPAPSQWNAGSLFCLYRTSKCGQRERELIAAAIASTQVNTSTSFCFGFVVLHNAINGLVFVAILER